MRSPADLQGTDGRAKDLVFFGLLEAEEYGVTQANADKLRAESQDPVVQRLLGADKAEDLGQLLGVFEVLQGQIDRLAQGRQHGVFEAVAMPQSNTRNYRADTGESLYRRSLYTFWKRTAPNPTMEILNAPSREKFCVRRERTNTPLHALVTLNDTTFVEAARVLVNAQAVQTGPRGKFVWVLNKAENTVAIRDVAVGKPYFSQGLAEKLAEQD